MVKTAEGRERLQLQVSEEGAIQRKEPEVEGILERHFIFTVTITITVRMREKR